MTDAGTVVYSSTSVLGADGLGPADVVVTGGRIAAMAAHGTADGDRVDVGDRILAPGLIDVQFNGALGIDLTAEPERLWELAGRLPEMGLTAFCPTIVTAEPGTVDRAIAAWSQRPSGFVGAEPIGLHLEGPMISPRRAGAHPPALIRPRVVVDGWSAPAVRIVTLAPEEIDRRGTGPDLIADLVARGIVVALGHTDADFETAVAAFEAGARHTTHLFSAMRPLHHRDPGVVVAALLDDRVTIGMIPDGVHTHPAILSLVMRTVGLDRFVATTDAMAAAGMPPGSHPLGEYEVVSDGVRATLPDGTLAGSVLTPVASVRMLADLAGIDTAASLRAHTANPARLLADPDRGALRPDTRADIVVIGPDATADLTVVGGTIAHRSE